jgi:choline dehydrogenase-like flavoprotein
MPFAETVGASYDVALIGTGFSSSFFLAGFLPRARPNLRVIVLERGPRWEHARRVETRSLSPFPSESLQRRSGVEDKRWVFTIAFGGGSNCWWGNAPRFLPADFKMKTLFGVGEDWPLSYEDLAPYYERVEAEMALSGPPAPWPFPRSAPYTQPPHRLNAPEELLKRAYPDAFFNVPTARARIATEGRGACCANGICHLCPVDAKWTVQNSFTRVYDDPRVTVVTGAEALAIDTSAGVARGIRYRQGGREASVRADLVAVGANAVFNPVLLQRSGLDHPMLGRRLHEQIGLTADVYLDGLESFQGSTSVTGHYYGLYTDDARRRQMAACLIETWNIGLLRTEPGRWAQVLPVRLVYDVLPDPANYVRDDPADPNRPRLHYAGHSAYTQRALDRAQADLEKVMAPLPVERIAIRNEIQETESHILGTTVMGNNPATSIVDRNSVHHRVRNLLVMGGSTFPVSTPANPSLTISALALRAGELQAA